MHCFRSKFFLWIAAGMLFLTAVPAPAASKESSLPPQYRLWLERDVAYIITSEERQTFLNLASDKDRDTFIDEFWEIRNPTPGAPKNPYKDEIYRRIAYANDHFGREGWRTDRGRVYITLGAPAQVGKYLGIPNVRPMEIWFYQSAHPALPPFFYVLFYQREVGDEFRLYSPYVDGPEKLMIGAGNENDKVAALNIIDREAGREVARTTLSLIPSEPVDMDTASTSLASDVMLGTIRGLANNPFTKDDLRERRRLLEAVSHRVILGEEFLDVLTVPLVDPAGNTNLHYVLRLKRPEDFSLQQSKDNQYYYSMDVVARVLTSDNKLIFTQDRKLSRYLDARQVEQIKNKVFGYEGVLPLPPGKYNIEFVLSNDLLKTAFRDKREVIVPQRPSAGLQVTGVVPFSDAETVLAGSRPQPFTAAGVKFTPLMGQGLSVVLGKDFKFFYQIWAPPADPKSYGDSKLHVEYAYGRMGLQDTKTLQEDVPRSQFTSSGTLINGKSIPTASLEVGNYRLMVTVTDPDTHQKAFSPLSFHVVSDELPNRAWDVTDDGADEQARQGVPDQQRALCYLAEGDDDNAISWFARAYQKNPADEMTRSKLVDLLFAKQRFGEIAQVYSSGGVSERTDDQTVVHMAESFDKLGQIGKSIQLLESAVALRPSGSLYLLLADYYHRTGNAEKAAEMERKAKLVASAASQS